MHWYVFFINLIVTIKSSAFLKSCLSGYRLFAYTGRLTVEGLFLVALLGLLVRVGVVVCQRPQDGLRDGWWGWQMGSLGLETVLVGNVGNADRGAIWSGILE